MATTQLGKFLYNCEVALSSHSCFPIKLAFLQQLNALIACPGSPPESSNHTRRQFLHLPSYLLLNYSDQSLITRSPGREFSTRVTLALHLAQPHCTNSVNMDTIYNITQVIYNISALSACFNHIQLGKFINIYILQKTISNKIEDETRKVI